MAKARRPMDPALDALVRERLEGDEMVLGWSEFRPGEVTVQLISEEMNRVCGPIAGEFGRTLQFNLQDGRWVFQGVGGWIS